MGNMTGKKSKELETGMIQMIHMSDFCIGWRHEK
jgi:hypothetical protein